jgi:hypothetical protein
LFIHERACANFPRVNSIHECVFKHSPHARTKLDTFLMPIETVNISFNEPEPGTPEVPYQDPVIRHWDTKPYGTFMIHLNQGMSRMTEADLCKYRQWVDRVPRILQANRLTEEFTKEFCKDANALAFLIQAIILAAGTKSPDLHV